MLDTIFFPVLLIIAGILLAYLVYTKIKARKGNEQIKFVLVVVLIFIFFYGSIWLIIFNP